MDIGAEVVQRIVNDMFRSRKTVRVLEAGCGSRSHVRLGSDAYLVGIDISQEQLERNIVLHERILGDIQSFPFPPRSFDIVFCWDVLEHIPRPKKALENFEKTVREDGIIVLGSPVANSLKGLITKYTPYWFHVMIYRRVLGNRLAGTNGYGPFPTFMRFSMSPRSICRFADKNNLGIEMFHTYEDIVQRNLRGKSRLLDLAFKTLGRLIKILSFGWIDPDGSDFIVVLRKRTAACA